MFYENWYNRVVFLPPVTFSDPVRPANRHPAYRPQSPYSLIEGIPNPGRQIHRDLSFCRSIWRIAPTDREVFGDSRIGSKPHATGREGSQPREHYVILPGVQVIRTEKPTGWHRCQFGCNLSDGYYYLEHYLAMEERPQLFTPRGLEDPDKRTAFVVTIRPAFNWQDHYRLSPPGYREHGLYDRMGDGIGPVPAVDGVHGQPVEPGDSYTPDTPQQRLGSNPIGPDEPLDRKPDYTALARRTSVILPGWERWMRFCVCLNDQARLNGPGWLFRQTPLITEQDSLKRQELRRLELAHRNRPLLGRATPIADGLPPAVNGAGSKANTRRRSTSAPHCPAEQSASFSNNSLDVPRGGNLDIELRTQ